MEAFITSMLDRLLMTSVQAAVLAAVAWLLCRPALRLSPATQCWLWWLVAMQAVLGLCVDPVRLPWLPHAAVAAASVAVPMDGNLPATGPMAMATRGPVSWQAAVLLLWAGGVAVMLLATLRDWQRARRLLQRSAPCADQRSMHAIVAAARACGLRTAPRLRVSRDIGSPMVIGPLRPVLLLPADGELSNEELGMAVAHELAHLRRADLWLGLVPALARHCFFFHPLVHVAVREYGIAREAACDAAVVQAGDHTRHQYGELLLRLGTATPSSAGLAAVSPTFRALSRRLMLLQDAAFAPRAGSVVLLAFALAGVLPLRLVAATAEAPTVVLIAAPTLQPRQPAQAVRVATVITADSRPGIAYRPDAADYYPAGSMAAGEQGIARVHLCYDGTGKVTGSTLAEGTGFARLDDAAVNMGRRFRFRPALVDGVAKADCLVVPVRFSSTLDAATAPVPTRVMPVATQASTPVPVTDTVAGIAYRPDAADFYPNVSIVAGEQGIVRLRLCYDETGRVVEPTVADGSGFKRLDDAALHMGKLFRMKPAVEGGLPKAGCVVVPVLFSSQPDDAAAARYSGPSMTVNFTDIDVPTLLRLIADNSGRRIVVDGSVTGTVTLNATNVPWEQLLDIVVRTKGLEKRVTANEIVIAAREKPSR